MKSEGAERGTLGALLAETSGVVLLEYVTVLVGMALIAIGILLAVELLQNPSYSLQREALKQPYP
jgi:hypothetical protein